MAFVHTVHSGAQHVCALECGEHAHTNRQVDDARGDGRTDRQTFETGGRRYMPSTHLPTHLPARMHARPNARSHEPEPMVALGERFALGVEAALDHLRRLEKTHSCGAIKILFLFWRCVWW